MTLFELMGFIGAAAGLVVGAKYGYSFGGVIGGIIGAIGGGLAGLFSAVGFVAGTFTIGIWRERWAAHRCLRRQFGRYWGPDVSEKWTRTKDQLKGGMRVTGKVIAAKYYGRFLDIGCGFPAVLKAVDEDELVRDLPEAGTTAEAFLLEYDDSARQVILTRRARTWVVVDGVPVGYVPKPPKGYDGLAIYFPLANSAHRELCQRLERGPVTCEVVNGVESVTVTVDKKDSMSLVMRPLGTSPGEQED